jgi:hypothetical protein
MRWEPGGLGKRPIVAGIWLAAACTPTLPPTLDMSDAGGLADAAADDATADAASADSMDAAEIDASDVTVGAAEADAPNAAFDAAKTSAPDATPGDTDGAVDGGDDTGPPGADASGVLSVSVGDLSLPARYCDGAPWPAVPFLITNGGTTPFTWAAAAVEPRPYFTLSPSGGTLAAGGQASIDVVPSAIPPNSVPDSDDGPLTRSIQIRTDAGDTAYVTVHEVIAGVFLAFSPAQLSFGTIPVGTMQSLTLSYSLLPNALTVQPYATLASNDPAFTSAPSSTFQGLIQTVTFAPTSAGPHAATLTLNAEGVCTIATSLAATGTGALTNAAACAAAGAATGTPCGAAGMICIPGDCVTQLALSGTPFSFQPGVAFSGQTASGSDWMNEVHVNPSAIAATIDWGDGTTSAGTVANPFPLGARPPPFAVTGNHTYASSGFFTVTVTATDSTTMNSVSTSFTVSG